MKLKKEQIEMLEKREKETRGNLTVAYVMFAFGILLTLFTLFWGILLLIASAWQYNSSKKELENIEFKLAGEQSKKDES